MRAAADVTTDQPGGFEHFDMLRCRRKRHRKRFGEFTHRPFAGGKLAEHRAARRVAEGVEDRIEPVRIMFNHVVEYGVSIFIVNRLVELFGGHPADPLSRVLAIERPIGRAFVHRLRQPLHSFGDPAIVEDRAIAGTNLQLPSLLVERLPQLFGFGSARKAHEFDGFSGPDGNAGRRRGGKAHALHAGFRAAGLEELDRRIDRLAFIADFDRTEDSGADAIVRQ